MSRLIDADALLEHVWRERLDSRERIANLVKSMPIIEPEQKKIALDGEALMEAFYATPKERRNWDEAWVLINRAKLAKPERTRGKWIEVTDHEIPIVCKCSVCEWRTKDYDWFSYCPNCGARMVNNEDRSD